MLFLLRFHRYGSGPKCFTVPVFHDVGHSNFQMQNPRRCWSPKRQHRAMVQRRLPCAWVCRSIPAPRSEPGAEHNSMLNWHTIKTFTKIEVDYKKTGVICQYANMLCQSTWKSMLIARPSEIYPVFCLKLSDDLGAGASLFMRDTMMWCPCTAWSRLLEPATATNHEFSNGIMKNN